MTKRDCTHNNVGPVDAPIRRRHVEILPLIEQYREKIDAHMKRYEIDDNGCWNWTGRTLKQKPPITGRYGAISLNKNTKLFVHRLSYAYHHNDEPAELVVRHKCHNSLCLNPEHLHTGTNDDNMRDMKEAGRSTFGEKSYHAKLSEQDVKFIITRLHLNSDAELARFVGYKVVPATIRRIRTGEAWAYLPRPNKEHQAA